MVNRFEQYSSPTPQDLLQFALKWTPRTIVAGFAGYYSLGVAYEMGIMAAIDRIAIRILRHFMGYAGIGAFMPTFQWYSAWGVRVASALGAGILYDLTERIIRLAMTRFSGHSTESKPSISTSLFSSSTNLHTAPTQRLNRGNRLTNQAAKHLQAVE